MTTSLVVAGFLSLLGTHGDDPENPASPVSVDVPEDARLDPPLDQVRPQDDAAAADEGPVWPHWSGNVDIGIVQKQGNTESLNGNLASKIVRDAEPSRTTITSWWLYEEDDGITERKYGVLGKYDWYLTKKRKNYIYGLGSVATDFASNIDTRYYAGGGLGWVLKDDEKVRFSTDFGATYLKEEFRDGSDDDSGNWTGIYDLTWTVNERATFDSDFIGLVSMTDSEDVLLSWIQSIAWDIGFNFRAGIRYVLDWDNTPAVGSKRDDHILAFTLGWKFGQK